MVIFDMKPNEKLTNYTGDDKMTESESIDERFILDNWNLLSEETRSMLEVIGISPNIQNGKETNQF